MFQNLDANETSFFLRELTSIKARTYDVLYPELKATKLIPVATDAGEGADTILYRQFDMFGMMKLISNYADDLPRADVAGKEFSVVVKSLGGSYGYNVQEIQSARFVGRPLEARRAEACRKAYEMAVNNYAWLADGSATYGGLYGIFFNPNVTKGTPVTGTWSTATADQIIADFNKAYEAVLTLTKGMEIPDTALMPIAQYSRIATLPRSTVSDTTVLAFLQAAHPGMLFDWINEAKSVANVAGYRPSGVIQSGVDCLLLYKRSPDKLTLEIPKPFTQMSPQERNLEYVVPAYGRIGGVVIYYPLSVYIQEGI